MTRFELTVIATEQTQAAARLAHRETQLCWAHHEYEVDDFSIYADYDEEEVDSLYVEVYCPKCDTRLETFEVVVKHFDLGLSDPFIRSVCDYECRECSRKKYESESDDEDTFIDAFGDKVRLA